MKIKRLFLRLAGKRRFFMKKFFMNNLFIYKELMDENENILFSCRDFMLN